MWYFSFAVAANTTDSLASSASSLLLHYHHRNCHCYHIFHTFDFYSSLMFTENFRLIFKFSIMIIMIIIKYEKRIRSDIAFSLSLSLSLSLVRLAVAVYSWAHLMATFYSNMKMLDVPSIFLFFFFFLPFFNGSPSLSPTKLTMHYISVRIENFDGAYLWIIILLWW